MGVNLTIGEIITKTVPFLNEKKIPNPRLEADLMLAEVLNYPRVKLYSQWDQPLQPAEVQRYREIIVKRVQGQPLAYLTGNKSFLSWEFAVNPSVLIPRPETEILVEAAFDLVKSKDQITGVDIGTGSGIIAVSLAKLLPNSIWFATDISQEALEVAKENAHSLGVDSRITFLNGDLFQSLFDKEVSLGKFDLIVSNPPYIPHDELEKLQPEVKQEPKLALDGGPDGLEIFRRLIPQAYDILADEGFLIFEHGYDQRVQLEEIGTEQGFSCRSLPDLAGLDRVLVCEKRVKKDA